jgi:HEAT repeat protein
MRCIAKGAGCVLVALLFVGQTHGANEGQNPRRSAASSGPFFAFAPGPRFTVEVGMMEPDERRGPKDPGYQSYREGYRLILEEQWAEARKKLSEVLQKTARSGYADDASFWIAYSWKYSDRAKAVAAYKKFMREYPESNYVDDALAELERLGERTPQLAPHDPGMPTGSLEKIVQLQQRIAEEQARVARFAAPPAVAVPMKPPKAVEATIRLKIETLQALSRLPHDEQSFRTLKEIALDPGQATELRQAGLEGLVATQRQEGVEVFTRVLQSTSDVRLRMTALHGLRSTGTKGDPALYALVKTIALDKNEPFELRDATLHLLAEERRPDFPEIAGTIARSEQERRLRQSAIYYIARVQEARAQKVAAEMLRKLLRDQTQAAEVRESALYGLQQMKMADSAPLLLEVAENDPDERVRRAAVQSIGALPGESPAVTSRTLEGIALDAAQPRPVRQSALARLLALNPENAQTFFAKVAASDPDEEIQYSAIMMLGQAARGENTSLGTLTRLYNQVPPERLRSLDVILYSVASIGSDPAVDFLVKVATESPSDELRLRAVSYLGNIGGEKARAGLYSILKRMQ